MTTITKAIHTARASVDIDKRGNEWVVRHIGSDSIIEGPSMDFFKARAECRRARIQYALMEMGWDDMKAERAAHVVNCAKRFEDTVREAVM